MTNDQESATPGRFAGFQFGLFHLFAVMTIAALTMSVLRVVRLPPLFLGILGCYLLAYVTFRGPFLAIKLSRLWQRRQQLLIERQHLERQLVETLNARREAKADEPASNGQATGNQSSNSQSNGDQLSDDGRSRNKFTL